MRCNGLFLFALGMSFFAISCYGGGLDLKTAGFSMGIDDSGRVTSIVDLKSGKDCLLKETESRLARIDMWDGKKPVPVSGFTVKSKGDGVWDADLSFANGVSGVVEIKVRGDYLTFELKSLSSKDVKYFVWGPLYVSLNKVVGGAVGVARDDAFAVCMRSLDMNTAGGLEGEEEVTGGIRDLKGAVRLGKRDPVATGARLAAYSKDRSRFELIPSASGIYKNVPAFPVKGETPIGSKIAVFGIQSPKVLDLLETIVKGEGMPHPTYGGVWTKRPGGPWVAPRLICPFSEKNVEEYIAIAKAGSFKMLHDKVPYVSKGTFEPKKDLFPNGYPGVLKCAEKIKAAGLIPAFHSLSAFIDFKDPLITPVPNMHLALCSLSKLSENIGAGDKKILLDSEFFDGFASGVSSSPAKTGGKSKAGSGKGGAAKSKRKRKSPPAVIRIGDELIQYKTAVQKGKTKVELGGCSRGFCSTKATDHAKGDVVGRCMLHKRKAFFPDIFFLPQIARNLAKIYVKGGMENTSFDGLESTDATGQGPYAQALFVDTVWNETMKAHPNGNFLSSSSRLGSYYWYLVSQETWGEPHAAGFRHEKSYYDGRIAGRIEKILIPSYVPYRLGQYQFSKLSTVVDIEWLLTKCVGLDGGWFDLYLSLDDYKASGDFGKKIMETISLWIEARKAGAFDPEKFPDMKEFDTVYRVTRDGDGFKVVKLSAEEAKEVVKPVVGKRKKKKNDREQYH